MALVFPKTHSDLVAGIIPSRYRRVYVLGSHEQCKFCRDGKVVWCATEDTGVGRVISRRQMLDRGLGLGVFAESAFGGPDVEYCEPGISPYLVVLVTESLPDQLQGRIRIRRV